MYSLKMATRYERVQKSYTNYKVQYTVFINPITYCVYCRSHFFISIISSSQSTQNPSLERFMQYLSWKGLLIDKGMNINVFHCGCFGHFIEPKNDLFVYYLIQLSMCSARIYLIFVYGCPFWCYISFILYDVFEEQWPFF